MVKEMAESWLRRFETLLSMLLYQLLELQTLSCIANVECVEATKFVNALLCVKLSHSHRFEMPNAGIEDEKSNQRQEYFGNQPN